MTAFFESFLSPTSAAVAVALVQCFLIVHVVALGPFVFIWAERKVSGRIQDRLGPTQVGGKFGWLQSLADGIKLISKEDLMPQDADPILFRIAPYVSFVPGLCAFIALPFGNGWVAQNLDVGLFFILAVLGLEVFGVILAGYASASKWSLFGAMREAAQVVSYEIPLGLCAVVPVVLAGSMNLHQIAQQQAGWFWNWYIFHDPFTFCTFWVFFACALASVNRAPFDLAEAESELVAGFLTEYSGIRWSYFFLAEYASMILVSGLAAILFFGGWNGPIPVAAMLGLTGDGLTGFLGQLLGVACFLTKASLGVVFMILIRWCLPRLRIDQVIDMCLKYCLPIACAALLGVAWWQWTFPGGLLPLRSPAEQRFGGPTPLAAPALRTPLGAAPTLRTQEGPI